MEIGGEDNKTIIEDSLYGSDKNGAAHVKVWAKNHYSATNTSLNF